MTNSGESFLALCEPLHKILQAIADAGGCAYAVGGSVRDLVLERKTKDLDIEVHNITLEQLEHVLANFGKVELVGKQFGVLLLYGMPVDWAVPRKDSKGRKPTVTLDPTMNFTQAARRRDVTMNAMGINLHDVVAKWDSLHASKSHQDFVAQLTIQDPYGGLQDLAAKRMRAVDEELFLEDPLRFFRVMQFVARFNMQPDDALNKLCTGMHLNDTELEKPIAKERVFEEVKKMLLQSEQPSKGFRWVASIGRLKELFPELADLVGAQQRQDYHPEGDVFEHTMQCVDAAAMLPDYQDTELFTADQERVLICCAMLCHDMGKPATTSEDLSAKGHDLAGVPLAKSL